MKITKETPVHQRRQIYVGSQVEVDIMNTREFHFSKILLDTITYIGLFKMLTNPKNTIWPKCTLKLSNGTKN